MTKVVLGLVVATLAVTVTVAMVVKELRSDRSVGEVSPTGADVSGAGHAASRDDSALRLTGALNALTQTVASLQERLARLEGKESEDEAEPPAQPPPRSAEPNIAEERVLAMERLDTIEESFVTEPRDPPWAKQMEGTLHEAFATGNFAGTRALETDCKSTFCRMAVEHDSEESSLQFELIKRRIPGSFYIQHLDADERGRSKTIAFFLRKGAEQHNVIAQLMGGPTTN